MSLAKRSRDPWNVGCREGWGTACLFCFSLHCQGEPSGIPEEIPGDQKGSLLPSILICSMILLNFQRFAQAGWAILPKKIIPGHHYKMFLAGKWLGDISGSHVLRYLIGDVVLKRKSNWMFNVPVGSFGLAKLSLWLPTGFLLENTRGRKREGRPVRISVRRSWCMMLQWLSLRKHCNLHRMYLPSCCQYYGHHL